SACTVTASASIRSANASAMTRWPGSFAAADSNRPRGVRSSTSTRRPSSSSSSRASVCAGLSAGSGFPPGCMNAVVPCLRTTSTRSASSVITAALTWMSGTVEHLSRVEDAERVEHPNDLTLQLPLVVSQLLRQPAALQHPDPMFSGERSTEPDRRTEEVVGGGPDPFWHLRALEDEVGVQIAVPGVGHRRDRQPVACFDPGDLV